MNILPEPSVNVIHNLLRPPFGVACRDIVSDPRDDVVFKRSLNELMKEVRRKDFVYVSARECVCEGLRWKYVSQDIRRPNVKLTTISPTIPYASHNIPSSNSFPSISVCARDLRTCRHESRSFEGAVQLKVLISKMLSALFK